MEANFLETMHWNLLKFLGHVTIIHMHLPMKQNFKWMYRYQENSKMDVGDGGQFLGNRVQEFAEIS